MKVTILEETLVFDDIFKIKEAFLTHEKYDGSTSAKVRRLCFERGDSVSAVVHHIGKKVLILTEQFRYPTYKKGPGRILELVAGSLKPKEDPKEGMVRELEEELGYRPLSIEEIGTFYLSPGGSSERIILFYIEVDESTRVSDGGGLASEHEDIKIVEFPADQAMSLDVQDAKTLIGISWFYQQAMKNILKHSHNKPNMLCSCVNSCVATIYVCKDCGGRVNSKR